MTDPETIHRVLSPHAADAAQVLRDLSLIRRIELILHKTGGIIMPAAANIRHERAAQSRK